MVRLMPKAWAASDRFFGYRFSMLVPAGTCLPAGCGVAELAKAIRILIRTVLVRAATAPAITVGVGPVLSAARCRIWIGNTFSEILLC